MKMSILSNISVLISCSTSAPHKVGNSTPQSIPALLFKNALERLQEQEFNLITLKLICEGLV